MILEVKNLEKSFGKKEVLKGVSFSACSGKAFGLLGRNGAGKTTAIRIIMGVFGADSGEILLDGKPYSRGDVSVGYLPEERGLYPKKKIIDQLVYFAKLKGMKTKDAQSAADRWLRRLGMENYRDKKLDALSKGNQQKIQLISALIHEPDVVVLDEPFSGLDPVSAKLLKDVVKEELQKGKCVIFSSHQMDHVEEFCDSVAILCDGKIAVGGELCEIKRAHGNGLIEVRGACCGKVLEKYGDRCRLTDGGAVITPAAGENKAELMSRLCLEYDVDCVKVYEPSLNDIFIRYAGKGDEVQI